MPLQLMLFSLLAGVIFIFVPSTRGKKDVVVFVFNIVSNNNMNARKKQYFCFRPKICFWVKFDPKAQNFWFKVKFLVFSIFASFVQKIY